MSSSKSNGVPTAHETLSNFVKDAKSQLSRIPDDLSTLKDIVESKLTKGVVDDRDNLLEHTVQWASSYPKDSPAGNLLTDKMLANLWDNLKHPPLSYMGPNWRYRAADGSNNNVLYPQLGQAGSYYARSVVPTRAPPASLPDPGDIFDALFARRGPAKEHPTKFSSIAISLATIIIHDVFRTDETDYNRVLSSSYLDLGPLYGHNQDMQNSVRTFKDGRLKPDAFAEPRLLGQPPGAAALLVSFNRFHNYVVSQLALINEGGRFSELTELDAANGVSKEEGIKKRDENLFQTGRLITCGLYVNIILHDYVRVILGLTKTDTTWNLDPRDSFFNAFDSEGTPKGIGNQVSMEFNLIYRWHATVSNKNDQWCRDFFQEIWPGKDPESLTQTDLRQGFRAWGHALDKDPGNWTFAGLKRTSNGTFKDADLVSLITATTEDVAGAFGARNVPTALRAIEILGIHQGRNWGTASLNEVRKFFNLRPHATFESINPDPEIAASLAGLYNEPDDVELYPGLVCEDTKPPMYPGSGLCAGLTVAKAILSDAVALVRGDRYYTVDNGPDSLTSFGFSEIQSRQDVGFGTCIYKLLIRAYPGWYRSDSVYALFPLTIPSENHNIMKQRGIESKFTYDPPSLIPPPTPVLSYNATVKIIKDQTNYKVPWGKHVGELIHHDWMLSGDAPWNTAQKQLCLHALYDVPGGLDEITQYYDTVTNQLIRDKSIKMRDYYQIDAVKDVGNISHAIVQAAVWRIPLSDKGLTAAQLSEAMAAVFQYTFLDLDTAQTLAVKNAAIDAVKLLEGAVSKSCKEVQQGQEFLGKLFSMEHKKEILPSYGDKMIQRLFASGRSLDEIIWTIIPTAAAAVPIQCQGIARLLTFYLDPKNATHWKAIQSLAHDTSDEAFDKLRKYALEGYRLSSPSAGVLRVVAAPNLVIEDGKNQIKPNPGQVLFLNFNTAAIDPSVFPDPLEVKLDRSDDLYIHHGLGPHACLGRKIVEKSMAVQLRAFARLKNLRRAAGPAGELKSTVVNGAFTVYANKDWSSWSPFPASWKLQYDA